MSIKSDHKKWRKQFNEDCLKRDNHKCKFCNIVENLDVHHITNRKLLPNGGYTIYNGITLCQDHHLLCENFVINQIFEYSPENLYKLINSSYDLALINSQKLNT